MDNSLKGSDTQADSTCQMEENDRSKAKQAGLVANASSPTDSPQPVEYPLNLTPPDGNKHLINFPISPSELLVPDILNQVECGKKITEVDEEHQASIEVKQQPEEDPTSATTNESNPFFSLEHGFGLRKRAGTIVSDACESRSDQLDKIPRIVKRNMPFKQSKQKISVVNKSLVSSWMLHRVLYSDWYHVFLRQPTLLSICFLLTGWTILVSLFALIYQRIDRNFSDIGCGLGKPDEPISFHGAFAFSLETTTTVGYGLPNGTNGFFENCKGLQAAIYVQMVLSMLFNAFLFSFMFARLARCEARGAQIVFSDKAIIEKRDGKWYLHIRVYDLASKHPLVEAHVRMYCVSWRDYNRQTRELLQPHLLHTMRITQPDDEQGAMMFTSIPANVTHHIDAFSPVAPLKIRRMAKILQPAGIPLREVDAISGYRNGVLCPVCGETFGSMDHLARHVTYQRMAEKKDNWPEVGSHLDEKLVFPELFEPFVLTESDIREQLRDKEIMVVVEAIEPMVSGTFQALQSYKLEDIVFGGRFAPCMSQRDGQIFVDFDNFHKILAPEDSSLHRYSRFNGGRMRQQTPNRNYLAQDIITRFYSKPDNDSH